MANKKPLDIVLLIALPASGKSEVRKYLEQMPVEKRIADFHMGETVQFDDFPYVHLMRCIDQELVKMGQPRLYYHADDKPFFRAEDWGTLIELLNDDYNEIVNKKTVKPSSVVDYYLDRIEAASLKVGLPKRLSTLSKDTHETLKKNLEKECAKMFADKQKLLAADLKGKTIVIEFARGGPDGSSMPLTDGFGYQYSFAKFAAPILDKAVLLYIWVTPEESRRKNRDRSDPNDPGSILHHGVPEAVMFGDYGCDDIEWLEKHSEVPGSITVKAYGKSYHLPISKFDNRKDKTSFLRTDPKQWKPEDVKAIHDGLKAALDKLAK
jgi:hypothetical protein